MRATTAKRFCRRSGARGFTLLEVVVALAILALGLGVLLQAEASSLSAAGRTRGLTIATLLTRAKLIDIEQHLFDAGFTLGDTQDEGDFSDDGHPEVKWTYRVIEVQLDLDMLQKFGSSSDDSSVGSSVGSSAGSSTSDLGALATGMGAPLDALTKQTGESMRVVDLTVSWPSGKYTESTRVRMVVTRDDLGISSQQQQSQQQQQQAR